MTETSLAPLRRIKEDDGDELHYAVIGPDGAAHFHYVTNYPRGFLGGLEAHSAEKPDYLDDGAKHEKCWLLEKPCWHDGSSLAADEYRDLIGDDDAIYEKLEATYHLWWPT